MDNVTQHPTSWKTLLALGGLAITTLLGRSLWLTGAFPQTGAINPHGVLAQVGVPQLPPMAPAPPVPPRPEIPTDAMSTQRVITQDIRRIVADPLNPQVHQVEVRTFTAGNPNRRQADDTVTREIEGLLTQLRKVESEQRDPAKLAELRGLLARQFQLRHDDQVARLKKVLSDAQRSQEILEQRSAQRDEIIARRMDELLGQGDTLDWDYQFRPDIGSQAPGGAPGQRTPSSTGSSSVPAGPGAAGVNRPIPAQPPTPPTPPQAPDRVGTNPFGGMLPKAEIEQLLRAQQSLQQAQASARQMQAQLAKQRPELNSEPSSAAIADKVGEGKIIEETEVEEVHGQLADAPKAESQGLMALAFRVRGLKEQLARVEAMHQRAALPYHELSELKNELDMTEAAWDHQLQALNRKFQIQLLELDDMELEVKILTDELQAANRRHSEGDKSGADALAQIERKLQQARNAVTRKKIELEAVRQDLEWVKDFKQQLEKKEDSTSVVEEDSETQSAKLKRDTQAEEATSQSEDASFEKAGTEPTEPNTSS